MMPLQLWLVKMSMMVSIIAQAAWRGYLARHGGKGKGKAKGKMAKKPSKKKR